MFSVYIGGEIIFLTTQKVQTLYLTTFQRVNFFSINARSATMSGNVLSGHYVWKWIMTMEFEFVWLTSDSLTTFAFHWPFYILLYYICVQNLGPHYIFSKRTIAPDESYMVHPLITFTSSNCVCEHANK